MSVTVGVKKFTVSKCCPFWGNPDSVIWEIFVGRIRNPSNVYHLQRIWNPLSGIRIPQRGIQTPRLFCISFQGVTKAFDIALCNNCILTLLNGSFYRNVSHILVRYECLKVKFAAKSQSRLQLSLRRSKSNFRQDCTHLKGFGTWKYFSGDCFVLYVAIFASKSKPFDKDQC